MKHLEVSPGMLTKFVEQLLHHETLPVKWRRNVGEDNQFHEPAELSCAM